MSPNSWEFLANVIFRLVLSFHNLMCDDGVLENGLRFCRELRARHCVTLCV